MAVLLLASVASALLLAIALIILDRFVYRILRRLWSNNHRERHLSFAAEFPPSSEETLLVGDTQLADFRWEEHLGNQGYLDKEEHLDKQAVRNLGIPDETVAELNERLASVIANQPKTLLLHCGGTDIRLGYGAKFIRVEIERVLSTIRDSSPETEVVVLGLLPQHSRHAAKIKGMNRAVAELARHHEFVFVDLFDELADASGGLKSTYSEDGYHLWGAGYEVLLAGVSEVL